MAKRNPYANLEKQVDEYAKTLTSISKWESRLNRAVNALVTLRATRTRMEKRHPILLRWRYDQLPPVGAPSE